MNISKRYYITFLWAKFVHDVLYYRRTYLRMKSPYPKRGTSMVIVSNHQNSLNDAMGIILTMRGQKVWFMARADVFKNKFISKLLTFLGIMPVYRQRDGHANLKNNFDIFGKAEDFILQGIPICLFPEAKHQDRHYLGKFYLSYTRLAFEAAERSNFEKEIFILPSANHYQDYFSIQSDLLISYGNCISLKPYYQLYKENPRKAQEIVNDIVYKEVREMMLDIQEEEHYQEIYDILGNFGVDYAIANKTNPYKLPDKLKIDQTIVATIEAEKEKNFDNFKHICQLSKEYSLLLKQTNLSDICIKNTYSWISFVLNFLLLLLLFPLFVFGLVHHIVQYFLPKRISRKFKDKLLRPSVDLAMAMTITIPITYFIFMILYPSFIHPFWLGILVYLCVPWTGRIAGFWIRKSNLYINMVRAFYIKNTNKNLWNSLTNKRKELINIMFSLMQKS